MVTLLVRDANTGRLLKTQQAAAGTEVVVYHRGYSEQTVYVGDGPQQEVYLIQRFRML